MNRAFVLVLTLTACSCASDAIVPDAQQQIATLQDHYAKALEAHHGVCTPLCYRASAAIVTANSERTAATIAVAVAATDEFSREP